MSNFVMTGYTLDQPNYVKPDLVMYYDVKGKTNRGTYRHVLLNMITARDYSTVLNTNDTITSGYALEGLALDGFDDYVLATLPQDLTACTLETVMLLDPNVDNYQTIFQVDYSPQKWALRLNRTVLELIDSTGTVVATTGAVSSYLGSITQIRLELSATTCSIFLNGTSMFTGTIPTMPLGLTGDYVCVGAAFPNSGYAKGVFFSLRLYCAILDGVSATSNLAVDQSRWGLALS